MHMIYSLVTLLKTSFPITGSHLDQRQREKQEVQRDTHLEMLPGLCLDKVAKVESPSSCMWIKLHNTQKAKFLLKRHLKGNRNITVLTLFCTWIALHFTC